jgi:hypothetical protein
VFTLQVYLPQHYGSGWEGNVNLVLQVPSLGIWEYMNADSSLDQLTPGAFEELQFVPAESARERLLGASYSDLRVNLIVGQPQGPFVCCC